ncbi:hypothetical protein TNCV_2814301 [Trichonephila clavipes]|nr:hypothetical protein TNCV_2814301 [Trichonephila clavipes]
MTKCKRKGSLAVGKNATNYDGEVLAVCEVAMCLLSTGLTPAKVVFFIVSQATILALSIGPKSRWDPRQCETVDQKAREGAESTQPDFPLTFRRAKSIISPHIDKYTAMTQKTKSFGKPWNLWPLWTQSRGTWRKPRLLPAFT